MMAACGFTHTLVVTQDCGLWTCGGGFDDARSRYIVDRRLFERVGLVAFGGVRVVAAEAGISHSAAVTEDGALWTWGLGSDGRRELVSLAPSLSQSEGVGESGLSLGTLILTHGVWPVSLINRKKMHSLKGCPPIPQQRCPEWRARFPS